MGKNKPKVNRGRLATSEYIQAPPITNTPITVFLYPDLSVQVLEEDVVPTQGSEKAFAAAATGKLDTYMKLCTNWCGGRCVNEDRCYFVHIRSYQGVTPAIPVTSLSPPPNLLLMDQHHVHVNSSSTVLPPALPYIALEQATNNSSNVAAVMGGTSNNVMTSTNRRTGAYTAQDHMMRQHQLMLASYHAPSLHAGVEAPPPIDHFQHHHHHHQQQHHHNYDHMTTNGGIGGDEEAGSHLASIMHSISNIVDC
eukprot:PhF_6_TR9067/c0_g1_i1/m.14130